MANALTLFRKDVSYMAMFAAPQVMWQPKTDML
jgi:hypothetical protein